MDTAEFLAKRGTVITNAEYKEYLRKYYPDTDKYILHSGNSVTQVRAFQAKNPGYYHYKNFFDSSKSEHFNTAFPSHHNRLDDGEASSKAICEVATNQITVFGAAHYQTVALESFYKSVEAEPINGAVRTGRLKAINHMVKDATEPSQIMATENGDGLFTYQNGYTANTQNHTEVETATPQSPGGESTSETSNTTDPVTVEKPDVHI